jgi:hypothetical protein
VPRVAEVETAGTWRNIPHELDRMHLVTFFLRAKGQSRSTRRSCQASGPPHAALKRQQPPLFFDVTPAADLGELL